MPYHTRALSRHSAQLVKALPTRLTPNIAPACITQSTAVVCFCIPMALYGCSGLLLTTSHCATMYGCCERQECCCRFIVCYRVARAFCGCRDLLLAPYSFYHVPMASVDARNAAATSYCAIVYTMGSCECRDLLLALHNVPQEYSEAAIKGVLDELTPQHVRIMWSSKLFQVRLCFHCLFWGARLWAKYGLQNVNLPLGCFIKDCSIAQLSPVREI